MLLRRFNESGIERFREFITQLKNDKTLGPPMDLLEDGTLTEVIQPATDCPEATFSNRLDAAAQYLDGCFATRGWRMYSVTWVCGLGWLSGSTLN
jgi:hypothetical protein